VIDLFGYSAAHTRKTRPDVQNSFSRRTFPHLNPKTDRPHLTQGHLSPQPKSIKPLPFQPTGLPIEQLHRRNQQPNKKKQESKSKMSSYIVFPPAAPTAPTANVFIPQVTTYAP
jgi:hypothetical protein